MKFSYNWLQSFFNRRLPKAEKLADLLNMHFAEVEEIKRSGQDYIFDIDIRPNRAGDCFSHIGVAREISAILNYKFNLKANSVFEDKKMRAKDFASVRINNQSACPRYTARIIADVKVGPSPKWLREKLTVCGLRPINNIVDIANYVMLETGQPLHTFDLDKLEGKKLIVRFAKKGERIVTLDEEKYDLDENILVIADAEKPVAIAGIKGGKIPEIDQKTKMVLLESANFNSRVIRRSSKRIDLKTDASSRFEHGIDPNLTELAINRAAFLIKKFAKGRVTQDLIDIYPKKSLPRIIKLDLNYLESLLGTKVSEKEVKDILQRLDFKIRNVRSKNILEIESPTRRIDVLLPEDLIEEVGRIYGYYKIPSIFPISSLIPPKKNLNVFWEDIVKNSLKEAGFTEIYNYSFISEEDKKKFQYKEKELVELENPLSTDFQYLRPSLIPNLLKGIKKNQKNFSEIRIFELGKIFRAKSEKRMIGGAVTGNGFYETKGVIDSLLNNLGIGDVCWYDEHKPTPEDSKQSIWHHNKCAEVKVGKQEIGFLGEVSSKILNNIGIEGKVVLFDIDFEKLSVLASEEHEYRPISRFPSAVRDLAVLVPGKVRVAQVLNKIYTAGKKIVRDVDLFDIYEGEEISAGKKNLAFHIIYQSEDKTLTSEEINKVQNEIIKNLEKEPEWQVRK